jgi:ribosome maturation factor RimP
MIDKYELQDKLKTVIGDYLKDENVILVDLSFKAQRGKSVLRILVDEPNGGITLDRCAYLNNTISQLLDRENLIETSYVLEVYSPGLDRPLLTRDDFSRCVNRKVRIFLDESKDGRNEIRGVITLVSDEGLNLDSEDKVQYIPFVNIKKAKQVV